VGDLVNKTASDSSSGEELLRPAPSTLIPAEAIARRVGELSAAIERDYEGLQPVVVTVLLGAFVFAADLIRGISLPLELGTVVISSYPSGTRRAGKPRLLSDTAVDVSGRHVIVVEDIVDSGQTVTALLALLHRRAPATLSVVALLDKPAARETEVPLRYTGFQIPDAFVVGYGMDCSGLYRNLPYVGVLSETGSA
jgi:hypoxanthine phosphoribosyltransferase